MKSQELTEKDSNDVGGAGKGNAPYMWYIKTKDYERIPFYLSGSKENPLETIPEFNQGDYWEIDFKSDKYKTSPNDDSFVLIPKSDVIDVWVEKNSMSKEMREQINKFKNLLKEDIDNTENETPSIYQAFLFGCYLSYPNDFKINDEGHLVDERNLFTSDFNDWLRKGGKVSK